MGPVRIMGRIQTMVVCEHFWIQSFSFLRISSSICSGEKFWKLFNQSIIFNFMFTQGFIYKIFTCTFVPMIAKNASVSKNISILHACEIYRLRGFLPLNHSFISYIEGVRKWLPPSRSQLVRLALIQNTSWKLPI